MARTAVCPVGAGGYMYIYVCIYIYMYRVWLQVVCVTHRAPSSLETPNVGTIADVKDSSPCGAFLASQRKAKTSTSKGSAQRPQRRHRLPASAHQGCRAGSAASPRHRPIDERSMPCAADVPAGSGGGGDCLSTRRPEQLCELRQWERLAKAGKAEWAARGRLPREAKAMRPMWQQPASPGRLLGPDRWIDVPGMRQARAYAKDVPHKGQDQRWQCVQMLRRHRARKAGLPMEGRDM